VDVSVAAAAVKQEGGAGPSQAICDECSEAVEGTPIKLIACGHTFCKACLSDYCHAADLQTAAAGDTNECHVCPSCTKRMSRDEMKKAKAEVGDDDQSGVTDRAGGGM
jgi:hypothetical protein